MRSINHVQTKIKAHVTYLNLIWRDSSSDNGLIGFLNVK